MTERDRVLDRARLLRAVWEADRAALGELVPRMRTEARGRVRAEETLLQCVLFFGFPRVVLAFGWLDELWPSSDESRILRPDAVPAEEQGVRGSALFEQVYAQQTERVLRRLDRHHPDLCSFVLEAAYGRVLSRQGLDLVERELLACVALALLAQPAQLLGHARAALRFGASRDDLLGLLREVGVGEADVAELADRL